MEYFFLSESLHSNARGIHYRNVEKGFWEEINSDSRQCVLIVSELSEVIEAHRLGRFFNRDAFNQSMLKGPRNFKKAFVENIKGTVEVELADAWIRIVDWHYYLLKESPTITPEFESVESSWVVGLSLEEFISQLMYQVLHLRVTKVHLNSLRGAIEAYCIDRGYNLKFFIENKMTYNSYRPKYHAKAY